MADQTAYHEGAKALKDKGYLVETFANVSPARPAAAAPVSLSGAFGQSAGEGGSTGSDTPVLSDTKITFPLMKEARAHGAEIEQAALGYMDARKVMDSLGEQIRAHPDYRNMSALKQADVWRLSSDIYLHPRRGDGLALSFDELEGQASLTEDYGCYVQIAHRLHKAIEEKAPGLAAQLDRFCTQESAGIAAAAPKAGAAPDMTLSGVHHE